MRRSVLVALGAVGFWLSVANGWSVVPVAAAPAVAQQVINPNDRPQIVPTPASDGKAMFAAYCAACHGRDGKGDGPVGLSLKTKPADLTKITSRNNGTFPEVRIRRWIEGLDTIPAHGSREMPIWGPLFLQLDARTPGLVDLRVQNLSEYLKGIQQK
jgi:mono/diheme cytochrome c family protein